MPSGSLRPQRDCCSISGFSFSSTFLFLSLVLPASSFAQLTDQASEITLPLSPSPTTLLTSSISSSSSNNAATSRSPSATPNSSPPGSPSDPGNQQIDGETHVFNYYFLIVAIVAVLFCICMLYIGRRKKRKATLLRNNSQRALAQDVAGFRTRFGRPRNYNAFGFGLGGGAGNAVEQREEGLDERGEAPPPYVPGAKPPSLRSVDVAGVGVERGTSSHGVGDTLELSRLSVDRHNARMSDPPGYSDPPAAGPSEDIGDITRPTAAVTTSQSFSSTRRLLSSTEGSTHT